MGILGGLDLGKGLGENWEAGIRAMQDGRNSPAGTNFQGSVWGSPIPISSGFRRINGAVIWAGAPYKDEIKTVVMPPVIPEFGTSIDTTWLIKRTFAVAVGRRLNNDDPPPRVRRIWANDGLAYSNGASVPLAWSNITRDYLPTGRWINGVWVPLEGAEGEGPAIPLSSDGTIPAINNPAKSTLQFRFYPGSEDQMPDPALVAALGDDATAFRGLMYFVVEGLIVGKGSDFQMHNLPGAQKEVQVGQQYVEPTNFPQLSVELEDTNTTASSIHDFTMLDSPVFTNPDQFMVADWEEREIAVICVINSGGGTLHIGDVDEKIEKEFAPIVDVDRIGGSYLAWDKINDIFYTSSRLTDAQLNHPYVSVNRDGTVVSKGLDSSPNNPENIDNTFPITDDKPAIRMPEPHNACVAHFLVGNETKPVLFGGFLNWIGMPMPSATGVIEPRLLPRSILEIDGFELVSCQPFPLLGKAIADAQPYQDCAFLVALESASAVGEVRVIYVGTVEADGTYNAFVRGQETVYTSQVFNSRLCSMLDQDGNILIQEVPPAAAALLTRVNIAYEPSGGPDNNFNGICPVVGGRSLDQFESGEDYFWDGPSVQESDVSAGTLSIQSGQLLDLKTGTTTAISLAAAASSTNIWDSQQQVRFYHGTVSGYGHGWKYGQVLLGTDGDINRLSKYLRDLSHLAGFTDGDLDIDSNLTDQVPGMLINRAYDLDTLFDDIGAMYDFTFYNAGSKLRFRREDNSPKKATGGITFAVNPTDGQTLTIGTVVYRFKTTPSAPFDVKLSANTSDTALDAKEKTCANLLAAITGDMTLAAADSLGDAFFAGTVTNTFVTAKRVLSSQNAYGFTQIALEAIFGGVQGNAIALAETTSGVNMSGTFMTGGAEAAEPLRTLELEDLMPVGENNLSDHDSLITTIAPLGAGQKAASLAYFALEQDYAPLVQTYIPDDQGGTQPTSSTTVRYEIPFIISTSEAYMRVSRAQIAQGADVITQQLRLPPSQLVLEPSDVVTINIPPYSYTVRFDEVTLNGDYSTSVTALNYSFRNDVTISDSDSRSRLPQTVPTDNDGLPVVIDAPTLSAGVGTIPGRFDLRDGIRAYTTGFELGALSFGATIGDATNLFTTELDVKWGTLSGGAPTAVEPFMATVEDSITISSKTILAADLASATDYYSFVAGENCLLYGRPGAWEYIYFRDVEVLNPKTFRLTGLIRGQRGTENFANTHLAGDVALLVASAATTFTNPLRVQTVTSDLVGDVYNYYATGLPAGRAPTTLAVTYEGLPLFPFAPGHLSAELVGGNDIELAWVRRDRRAQEFVTEDQTLSEVSEEYEVDILSGTTVVHTATGLTTPEYTYTSADQVTDGFTPPLATLKVRVYQVGELGRGFPREETLNVD